MYRRDALRKHWNFSRNVPPRYIVGRYPRVRVSPPWILFNLLRLSPVFLAEAKLVLVESSRIVYRPSRDSATQEVNYERSKLRAS